MNTDRLRKELQFHDASPFFVFSLAAGNVLGAVECGDKAQEKDSFLLTGFMRLALKGYDLLGRKNTDLQHLDTAMEHHAGRALVPETMSRFLTTSDPSTQTAMFVVVDEAMETFAQASEAHDQPPADFVQSIPSLAEFFVTQLECDWLAIPPFSPGYKQFIIRFLGILQQVLTQSYGVSGKAQQLAPTL